MDIIWPEEYAKALWFERYADTTFSDISYKKVFMESVIKPALLNQAGNKEIVEYSIKNDLPPMLDYVNQAIMRQGRWKQVGTVMEYIEAAQRFEENAAGLVLQKIPQKTERGGWSQIP